MKNLVRERCIFGWSSRDRCEAKARDAALEHARFAFSEFVIQPKITGDAFVRDSSALQRAPHMLVIGVDRNDDTEVVAAMTDREDEVFHSARSISYEMLKTCGPPSVPRGPSHVECSIKERFQFIGGFCSVPPDRRQPLRKKNPSAADAVDVHPLVRHAGEVYAPQRVEYTPRYK